jgi:hypothetical protein
MCTHKYSNQDPNVSAVKSTFGGPIKAAKERAEHATDVSTLIAAF